MSRALEAAPKRAANTSSRSTLAARFGPWALVTGASEGIGRAFAEALADQGFHLVLVARRAERLASLADQLQAQHQIECRVLVADLSEPGVSGHLMEATRDIDIGLLVAAAGFGTSGPLLCGTLAQERDMLELNCGAVLDPTQHFGHRFAQRGRGAIVFMSSLLAFHGTPGAAHYAATKAYVQTLAEGLRTEWSAQGVEVIASAPGPVHTGFASRANMRMGQAMSAQTVARVTLRALGRSTTVRPGALSKLLGWSLAMLPRRARIKVIAGVMQGMTAHQQAAMRPSER